MWNFIFAAVVGTSVGIMFRISYELFHNYSSKRYAEEISKLEFHQRITTLSIAITRLSLEIHKNMDATNQLMKTYEKRQP